MQIPFSVCMRMADVRLLRNYRSSATQWFAGVAVAALMVVGASVTTTAQTRLVSSVLASGGAVRAGQGSEGSMMSCTIGQPLISARKSAAQTDLWEGFWTPWKPKTTSVDDDVVERSLRVYPNPMNEAAQIAIDAQLEGPVTVRIYDGVGTLVRTIEQSMSIAGAMSVSISATDVDGQRLASGAYVCMIEGTMLGGAPYRASARLSVIH